MDISADLINGYQINYTPDELIRPAGDMIRGFEASGNGYYKPIIYSEIPEYIVKDKEYFEGLAIGKATITHGRQYQRTLLELGLTLDFISWEFVKIESLDPVEWIADSMVVRCRGIPQLLAPVSGDVRIVSISGEFDTLTGMYYGNIATGVIDEDSSGEG